jgi:hypothetical protein
MSVGRDMMEMTGCGTGGFWLPGEQKEESLQHLLAVHLKFK